MLKKGSWILQAWCVINAIPGLACLVFIALGHHAPGARMLFTPDEIPGIEARALATIDGLAVLGNALIVGVCGLSLMLIRRALAKKERWAFNTLLLSLLFIQAMGYWSDAHFGFKNLIALNVSSAWLALGLGMCAREVFRKGLKPKRR